VTGAEAGGDLVVTVVGGGAMGSMFAAALASRGASVTVLDAASDVVEAIQARGVLVTDDGGTTSAQVRATSDPAEAVADVVIVFVKAQHTPVVATALPVYLTPGTTVVSLQNGWGNADVLAGAVPPGQLVVGVTYHSCTVLEPGHVQHTGKGATFVGPYADDNAMDRAQLVADLLSGAGLDVVPTAQARTEIWKKLVLNAATLPVAALTGLCAGDLARCAEPLALADDLAREAVAVARAKGMDLDTSERLSRIHSVLSNAGEGKASMLQDVLARRKTEVEVVNGAVAAAGREAGVAVPLNEAMVRLIHGLEGSWQT
jgi:2-dehydropantoate 2-reductase